MSTSILLSYYMIFEITSNCCACLWASVILEFDSKFFVLHLRRGESCIGYSGFPGLYQRANWTLCTNLVGLLPSQDSYRIITGGGQDSLSSEGVSSKYGVDPLCSGVFVEWRDEEVDSVCGITGFRLSK